MFIEGEFLNSAPSFNSAADRPPAPGRTQSNSFLFHNGSGYNTSGKNDGKSLLHQNSSGRLRFGTDSYGAKPVQVTGSGGSSGLSTEGDGLSSNSHESEVRNTGSTSPRTIQRTPSTTTATAATVTAAGMGSVDPLSGSDGKPHHDDVLHDREEESVLYTSVPSVPTHPQQQQQQQGTDQQETRGAAMETPSAAAGAVNLNGRASLDSLSFTEQIQQHQPQPERKQHGVRAESANSTKSRPIENSESSRSSAGSAVHGNAATLLHVAGLDDLAPPVSPQTPAFADKKNAKPSGALDFHRFSSPVPSVESSATVLAAANPVASPGTEPSLPLGHSTPTKSLLYKPSHLPPTRNGNSNSSSSRILANALGSYNSASAGSQTARSPVAAAVGLAGSGQRGKLPALTMGRPAALPTVTSTNMALAKPMKVGGAADTAGSPPPTSLPTNPCSNTSSFVTINGDVATAADGHAPEYVVPRPPSTSWIGPASPRKTSSQPTAGSSRVGSGGSTSASAARSLPSHTVMPVSSTRSTSNSTSSPSLSFASLTAQATPHAPGGVTASNNGNNHKNTHAAGETIADDRSWSVQPSPQLNSLSTTVPTPFTSSVPTGADGGGRSGGYGFEGSDSDIDRAAQAGASNRFSHAGGDVYHNDHMEEEAVEQDASDGTSKGREAEDSENEAAMGSVVHPQHKLHRTANGMKEAAVTTTTATPARPNRQELPSLAMSPMPSVSPYPPSPQELPKLPDLVAPRRQPRQQRPLSGCPRPFSTAEYSYEEDELDFGLDTAFPDSAPAQAAAAANDVVFSATAVSAPGQRDGGVSPYAFYSNSHNNNSNYYDYGNIGNVGSNPRRRARSRTPSVSPIPRTVIRPTAIRAMNGAVAASDAARTDPDGSSSSSTHDAYGLDGSASDPFLLPSATPVSPAVMFSYSELAETIRALDASADMQNGHDAQAAGFVAVTNVNSSSAGKHDSQPDIQHTYGGSMIDLLENDIPLPVGRGGEYGGEGHPRVNHSGITSGSHPSRSASMSPSSDASTSATTIISYEYDPARVSDSGSVRSDHDDERGLPEDDSSRDGDSSEYGEQEDTDSTSDDEDEGEEDEDDTEQRRHRHPTANADGDEDNNEANDFHGMFPQGYKGFTKLGGGRRSAAATEFDGTNVKRRLVPLDYLRELYLIEAFLGEDDVSESYRVRERKSAPGGVKRKFVARFFFTDKGKNFFTKSESKNRAARANPLLSRPMRQQIAISLLLDHPKLIRSYDFFYHSMDDAEDIKLSMQSVLSAGHGFGNGGDLSPNGSSNAMPHNGNNNKNNDKGDNGSAKAAGYLDSHLNPRLFAKGELGLTRKRVSLLTSQVLLPRRASFLGKDGTTQSQKTGKGPKEATAHGKNSISTADARPATIPKGGFSSTEVEPAVPSSHKSGSGSGNGSGRFGFDNKLPRAKKGKKDGKKKAGYFALGSSSTPGVSGAKVPAAATAAAAAGKAAAVIAKSTTMPNPFTAAKPASSPASTIFPNEAPPLPAKTPQQKLDELFVKLNRQIYTDDAHVCRQQQRQAGGGGVAEGDNASCSIEDENAEEEMDLLVDTTFIYGVLVSELVSGPMPPALQADRRNKSGDGGNGGLDEALVGIYCAQICEVLQYMHAFYSTVDMALTPRDGTGQSCPTHFDPCFIHNNLRGEHVLLDHRGNVKLTHLDSAAWLTAEAYHSHRHKSHHAGSGGPTTLQQLREKPDASVLLEDAMEDDELAKSGTLATLPGQSSTALYTNGLAVEVHGSSNSRKSAISDGSNTSSSNVSAASIPFPILPLDLTAPSVYIAPELSRYAAALRYECQKQQARRIDGFAQFKNAPELLRDSQRVTCYSYASFNYSSRKLENDMRKHVTPAIDCYQLGITLYRLLLGRLPYLQGHAPISPLNHAAAAASSAGGLRGSRGKGSVPSIHDSKQSSQIHSYGVSSSNARVTLQDLYDGSPKYASLSEEARNLIESLVLPPAEERPTVPQIVDHPFVKRVL